MGDREHIVYMVIPEMMDTEANIRALGLYNQTQTCPPLLPGQPLFQPGWSIS